MALLALLGLPALIAVQAILNGWVLSHLWRWFFVPVLDLPAIGIAQAIGISLVVGYLTHQIPKETTYEANKSKTEKFLEAVLMGVIRPLFALLIGFIVKIFI